MNKEEIRQFKSLLNQGILRHKNILLDYKFQSSLLEIIKDYERLQQENKLLKEQFDMIYKGKKLKLLSIEKCKNKYCFNYELESGDSNDRNTNI